MFNLKWWIWITIQLSSSAPVTREHFTSGSCSGGPGLCRVLWAPRQFNVILMGIYGDIFNVYLYRSEWVGWISVSIWIVGDILHSTSVCNIELWILVSSILLPLISDNTILPTLQFYWSMLIEEISRLLWVSSIIKEEYILMRGVRQINLLFFSTIPLQTLNLEIGFLLSVINPLVHTSCLPPPVPDITWPPLQTQSK